MTASLAAQYIRAKGHRLSLEEYGAFVEWVSMRFNRIRHLVDFTEQEVDPQMMLIHWDLWGRLLISTAHNKHPHWLPFMNAQFRAIHDWDHVIWGHGFDMEGETQAYLTAAATAPESIRWILYSEIVLQAAASIHTGEFQRQKLVKLS